MDGWTLLVLLLLMGAVVCATIETVRTRFGLVPAAIAMIAGALLIVFLRGGLAA